MNTREFLAYTENLPLKLNLASGILLILKNMKSNEAFEKTKQELEFDPTQPCLPWSTFLSIFENGIFWIINQILYINRSNLS